MPPRATPGRGGSPRGGRGRPQGAPSQRGGAGRGRGLGGFADQGSLQTGLPSTHIETVGVKRPGFGTSGRAIKVNVNAFISTVPDCIIRHYDVISVGLRAAFNLQLIKHLQTVTAPEIFNPLAVYDGRKNMYASHELDLGETGSREFDVIPDPIVPGGRPPKVFKIRITKVAEINTEIIQRYIDGKQSYDNQVSTALMALNVVIRMTPIMKYSFNTRSFYTDRREVKDIGRGLQLWRGYFQSVRPSIGRLLVNVDISTAMFYKAGPLISFCLEYLGRNQDQANFLSPSHGFPDRERRNLQNFIMHMKVTTEEPGRGVRTFTVQGLSAGGANQETFTLRDGKMSTVAAYFAQSNRRLRFPNLICVKVGSGGALIPLERCTVPKGQIVKKGIPPDVQSQFLDFASKSPGDRLASIRDGIEILEYGQSEYVRQFGMAIDTTSPTISSNARVLVPPTLKYGAGSKQITIAPKFGAWNMADKRFIKPTTIDQWVIVIYEGKGRFTLQHAAKMVGDFIQACGTVGMSVNEKSPLIRYENGQGNIGQSLKSAGQECMKTKGKPPSLIMAILPEGGNEIYRAVKHFGNVTMGVPTQCLISSKCKFAKIQYWANVLLKVNPKLGGINHVHQQSSVPGLADPLNPTMIMGADVMHPAPGSDTPSYSALVASVDSEAAVYIATDRVQTARQEIIPDLQEMCRHAIEMFANYQRNVEKKAANRAYPKKIIFYRDGVAETQFQQVLDQELTLLKKACEELGISPTITFIVVGKRHKYRLFPGHSDADRSGNCPAGTVIDRDITHPTDFDFYLQSHGGILGTSRSAHYSVLYDQNKFTADSIQALSFALCHVYARSTRSVSIPAPVYYAHIVCSTAKTRFDPSGSVQASDAGSQAGGQPDLESYKRAYKPVHQNQSRRMWFM